MKRAAVLAWLLLFTAAALAQRPELVVQSGHSAPNLSLALSADGRLLAAGARDNAITLWDTATGEQLRSLKGHTQSVSSLAFSATGALLASASYDGSVRLWDAETGATRFSIPGHALPVEAVALSPDGRILASGGFDNTVRLWSASSGAPLGVLTGHTGAVSSLAFTRDGKRLFSGSHDRTVKVWEVASATLVGTLEGHVAAVLGLALSADGKLLASAGGGYSGRGMVMVRDAASGKVRHSFTTRHEWLSSVAFSADGKTLLAGTNTQGGALQRWDLSTQPPQPSTLPTEAQAVYAVAFSADGRWFAATGRESNVTLWDARTWSRPRTLAGHVRAVSSLALTPDGKRLASAGQGNDIKLWDLAGATQIAALRGHENGVTALAFSPAGNLLASASYDGTVRLWDPASGKALHALRGHAGPVRCVAFSRDGTLVASGSDDRTIRIWDAVSGELLRTLTGHADMVRAVAFSPASDALLASGSADTSVRLWDAMSGALMRTLEGHQHWVQALSFRADGEVLASGSVDRTVRLWQVQSGAGLRRLDGHAAPVETVVFLPDGGRLASGGRDRSIKIWDAERATVLQSLEAHSDAVTALVTTKPADMMLWSASQDSQIRLWSVADGRSRASLTALDATDWAVVDADGRFDASQSGMELMHWVVGREPIALEQLLHRFWFPRLLPRLLGFDAEPLAEVASLAEVRLFPAAEFVGGVEGSKATVRLTNRGGGLGPVEVYVNNVRLIEDARPKGLDPKARQVTLSLDLSRAAFSSTQDNVIRVVTYNAEGYLRSRGVRLSYTPMYALAYESKQQLYAIVAGISSYATKELELKSKLPTRDAVKFAATLQVAGEKLFGRENVHVELYADAPGALGLPTKANLVEAFRRARRAAPEDTLVIYLAGHGFSIRNDKRDLYVYPTREAAFVDPNDVKDPQVLKSSALTSDELREWLTGPGAIRAQKRLMVLDTCAAGAGDVTLEKRGDESSAATRVLREMHEATGFYILMGSARDRKAYGSSPYGHGFLTYALLSGMKGPGLLQDRVQVPELLAYALREVPRFSRGIQLPQLASRYGGPFAIGLLDAQARAQIPLAAAKHVALQPQLTDPVAIGDTLELSAALAAALEVASEPAPGDLLGPPFTYLPGFAGGIRIDGVYSVQGDAVEVRLKLRLDGKEVGEVRESGSRQDLGALAKQLAALVVNAIAKLPPPPEPEKIS